MKAPTAGADGSHQHQQHDRRNERVGGGRKERGRLTDTTQIRQEEKDDRGHTDGYDRRLK